MPRIIKQSTNV